MPTRVTYSLIFLTVLSLFFVKATVNAQSTARVDELRQKITDRNTAIANLEKEIGQYQEQIEEVGKQSKTLQSTIKSLDLSGKKLTADLNVTENKIGKTNDTIEELGLQIQTKEKEIGASYDVIAESIRSINETDSQTLIETMLRYDNLSDFTDEIERLKQFQNAVEIKLLTLRELKVGLEGNKAETEKKKKELTTLKSTLADQKRIVEINKKEKDTLLKDTKNKETTYKKTLSEKVALRDAFAKELLDFESQLRFEIDPSRLPQTGSGVLSWPLEKVSITQNFGNTAFAQAGGYNGQGHNGIDLRASIGTAVKSALNGTVSGIGDTDSVCSGASYGKWVLIEHPNGLSTIYAHLSLIKVSAGQSVSTGEIIGYSGSTGYATGPHLHFTVYATQGVRIYDRKSAVCRGTYHIPVADFKAYLNPLLYL